MVRRSSVDRHRFDRDIVAIWVASFAWFAAGVAWSLFGRYLMGHLA